MGYLVSAAAAASYLAFSPTALLATAAFSGLVLAPQLPSLAYAPLPGLAFRLGTMCMQIVMGAIFASLMRVKHLAVEKLKYVGRLTAGNTLYYGGGAFFMMGALILAFPFIDSLDIGTGNPIPNLDSVGVSTLLIIAVVGIIGFGSMYKSYGDVVHRQAD
jgi:hypothetical protein